MKIEKKVEDAKKLLDEIQASHLELQATIIGSTKKIMQVKHANFMGQAYSSISSYKEFNMSRSWYTKDRTVDEICKVARAHADELFEKAKVTHEENLAAIDNNKRIYDAVTKFMVGIGMPSKYSTSSYKTNRSRTKTTVEHRAGWLDDLFREVKTDDSFTYSKQQYDEQVKRIDEYLKTETARLAKEKADADAKLRSQQDVAEAISYLNGEGKVCGVDYFIENAVKFAKDMRMPETEYVSLNAGKIIYGDDDKFTLVDTKLVDEWRHGTVKDAIVRSNKTGKQYEFSYRDSTGDMDFEDMNSGVIVSEIAGESKI
jgi:hypothetical protein